MLQWLRKQKDNFLIPLDNKIEFTNIVEKELSARLKDPSPRQTQA